MFKKRIKSALLIAVLAVCAVVAVVSCSKSSDTAATAQFVGKWNGTGCSSEITYINISSGPTNYSMYMSYTVGADTCAQGISLLASVSSNQLDNFSTETKQFTDKCGVSYSVSAAGTIVGDSIYITTFIQSPTTSGTACTFRGRK